MSRNYDGFYQNRKDMTNNILNCPDDLPIAMAYVPMQRWNGLYDLHKGFKTGTIFPELDKPFLGREAKQCADRRRNNY